MNRRMFVVLSGIALVAAGCAMAPTYERPNVPVPSEWPTGDAFQRSGEGAVAPAWREFFTDEKLRRLVEMALENNRDMRLATLNVERARAYYGIQRAELLPKVNAVGTGGREHVPADLSPTGSALTSEQYRVNLGIASWEIDFFGRIRSLKNQALEEYLATEEAANSARITLVSAVAQAYLVLAADREALSLARSVLETQTSAHDLMKKRHAVGLLTELDLRRSQIQVDTARGEIARYLQRTIMDRNALELLLGASAPGDLLPSDLNGVSFPVLSPGIRSDILLSRPDILQAEHRLKGAYANIGAARAAFFPRIALTTSIGTASAELSGLFRSGSEAWGFSPQIAFPIFDARLRSALKVSNTERKIILTQYEKAIQTAFRETADALAVAGTVEDQISAQQSLVKALSETCRLADERYEKGIDSFLGVLDARRSLYAAEQGLVALRLSKSVNQVKLHAVLGGGGGGR